MTSRMSLPQYGPHRMIIANNEKSLLPVKIATLHPWGYITLLWFHEAISHFRCILPLSEVYSIAIPKTVVLGLGHI